MCVSIILSYPIMSAIGDMAATAAASGGRASAEERDSVIEPLACVRDMSKLSMIDLNRKGTSTLTSLEPINRATDVKTRALMDLESSL